MSNDDNDIKLRPQSITSKRLIDMKSVGRNKYWTEQKLDLIRKMFDEDEDPTIQKLHEMFPDKSINAIRIQLNRLGLSLTEHRRRKRKRRRKTKRELDDVHIDDVAHRLAVLLGKSKELQKVETRMPTDDRLLEWRTDIESFCQDVLFLNKFNRDKGVFEFGPLELQDYQLDLIKMWERARYSVCVSGHQSGKDLTISAYTLWKSITVPNFFTIIVAPVQRLSDELYKTMSRFIAHSPLLYNCVDQPKVRETVFSNGSRIISLPAKGNITGYSRVNLAILNEAGRPDLPKDTIDDMVPWTSAVGGHLVLLGNPYHKTSRFYEALQDPVYERFSIKTEQNKYLDPEFLQNERKRLSPETYRRRYCGEFSDLEKAYYSGKSIDECQVSYIEYSPRPKKGFRYMMGIDWGRLRNKSVITLVGYDKDADLYELHYRKLFRRTRLREVASEATRIDKIFMPEKILPEYAGMSMEVVEDMESNPVIQRKIHRIESHDIGAKFRCYEFMTDLISKKKFKFPETDSELSIQLRSLEMKVLRVNTKGESILTVSAPRGFDDDIADSTAFALYGFKAEEQADYFTPYGF